ncbi:MAG TPA: LysM peptidoglycan-binding domain-containing protein [Flavobacterium sp.]|nr:LysM peptidoglycan-binding domain-containing protein [Flavobacterium sp.]
MKYFNCLFLIVFFSSMSLFSQEKYKQHTVSKGETISEIAKKYNVKPSAIYELNPDAVNGIKQKSVLLIPTKTKKNTTVSTPAIASKLSEKTHEVLPKETVYGIAKQHKITIEELYKINPNLEKEGLKIGQTIKIPQTGEDFATINEAEKSIEVKTPNVSKKNIPKEEIVVLPKLDEKKEIPTEGIQYEVLPKESLYSIAKKYGIKLDDLQKANPDLVNKPIKVGQKINVPIKTDANTTLVAEKVVEENKSKTENYTPVVQKPVVENKKLDAEKNISVVEKTSDEIKTTTNLTHEVLAKESLYSISKKYGISLSELKKANPDLGSQSIKVGQKITVPVKADVNSDLAAADKVSEKKEVQIEKEPVDNKQKSLITVTTKDDVDDKKSQTEITHEVLPKETKYGIAKQYGLTVAELEKQNPKISKKLLVGSVLKIQSNKVVEKSVPTEVVVVEEKKIEENLNTNPIMVRDEAFVDQLISKASENIGTKYRSGGTTTDGFDCSGLMCFTFANSDIKLPRSSAEMATYGSKIEAQNAQKGDLIFFKTRGSGRINHVGMVVEVLDGEIKFIHSATHGGVIISSTKESYYQKNFVQVNRVL